MVLTSHSNTSDIQIKWCFRKTERFHWFPLRRHPSTVITARSITPCQWEKYINTGFWRTPCLTWEWENYTAPSCPPTYSLQEETFDILHTVLNFRTTFKSFLNYSVQPIREALACWNSNLLLILMHFTKSGYNQYYPAIWFSIRPNYIAPYLFRAHTNHIHTGPQLFFMGEPISIPGATS